MSQNDYFHIRGSVETIRTYLEGINDELQHITSHIEDLKKHQPHQDEL